MANMKIENVVASTSLGQEIDLDKIMASLDGAEYNPKQFPGLVYRLKEPKTATLLFRSGKIVCTGGKSYTEVEAAITQVAKDLEKADIKITIKPKIEYEPEQFPGLVFRLDDPKVVVLLFGSGKMVCTGAKIPEDVTRAVEKIAAELRDASLMA